MGLEDLPKDETTSINKCVLYYYIPFTVGTLLFIGLLSCSVFLFYTACMLYILIIID